MARFVAANVSMQKSQKRLGEILVAKGIINEGQLKAALEEQKKSKKLLGDVLLEKHYIKEPDLLATLSEQFNIPVARLKDKYIDWNFVRGFSASLILDYKCFPLKIDASSVHIAITDPLDVWAMKKCEEEVRGLKLNLVLVSKEDLSDAVARYKQYVRGNIK